MAFPAPWPSVRTCLALAAVVGTLCAGAPPGPAADLQPLPSAAPQGLGPIALPGLSHTALGTAHVFRSARPDVFIFTRGRAAGLHLLPFLRTGPDDAPVFAPPRPLRAPFDGDRGAIFETPDGAIRCFWIEKNTLRQFTFDRTTLTFAPAGSVSLPSAVGGAQSLAVFPVADGAIDLVFEVAGEATPARSTVTNASSADWRPYDAAGISTAAFRYRYLVAARLPASGRGPLANLRQLSATRRETYWGMMQLSPLPLGLDRARGLIAGSRLGTFHFHPTIDAPPKTSEPLLVAGEDGNALRHPSVGAAPFAYPSSTAGSCHFLASGESALYFYGSTGRFSARGAPVFRDPVPLLQEQAALYAGTLPSPSVVDWDGDGVTDLVVGNSEGFILLFKNVGTDLAPRFFPGERLRAAGRDIHHQAGYSGSVQGTGEARWGYVSPTAFDWNEDGRPDLIVGDITGNYVIYLNRGTPTVPALEAARPLYCDGLDLHGMWRCRPAVGRLGQRIALVLPDGDDHLHLYWKIDDFNVADGGKLRLDDGSLISTTYDPAGGTGRCKLDFFDYDGDGRLDLLAGTGRRGAIPNRQSGYPLPILGQQTLNTPLLLRNVGTNERPVFAAPQPFAHATHGLVQPGGSHESGVVGTKLGGGPGANLLVANEAGRLFLLRGENLRLLTPSEAARYRNQPNPFPVSAPAPPK
ncbi:MAG: VCBS repeat-containing protein [Verrucomicrobia bacterium]|nr:VCBS repeat-containing protein [Verrucomicrobiota bacterium]